MANTLCVPNTVKSLNSLQQHINDSGVTGRDVIIAPNPSYSIDPYLLQTEKEPEHQYDYHNAMMPKLMSPLPQEVILLMFTLILTHPIHYHRVIKMLN